MVTSICHLWKIYFHKQFLTKNGVPAAAQILGDVDKSERKTVCLAASSHNHIVRDKHTRQHNRPVTTDQLQTAIMTQVSHTPRHPGSMQHSTTNVASLTVKTNESDSDVSVGSRRTQERRMTSTVGTYGRFATTKWSTGVGTEGHDQGSSLLERKEQEKPLLRFARMTRSQLADKARQLQIPETEQSTPKGTDYLGYGKHRARTYQDALQSTVVGPIKWRIISFIGNSRDSLRG